MKVVITRSILAEIVDHPLSPKTHLDEDALLADFIDSITDDTNDSTGSTHETSDGKFDYVPTEVHGVTVTKYVEEEQ